MVSAKKPSAAHRSPTVLSASLSHALNQTVKAAREIEMWKGSPVEGALTMANVEEHAATLGNFYLFFGDVQNTDELVARLETSSRRNEDAAE